MGLENDMVDHSYADRESAEHSVETSTPAPNAPFFIKENSRGDHLAIAALAGFGYVAMMAAFFLALRDRFSATSVELRATIMLALLLGTYVVASLFLRAKNMTACKLFAFFGAIFYGAVLVAISSTFPEKTEVQRLSAFFTETLPSVLPYWALGAFAIAMAFRSAAIHYVAAALVLFTTLNNSHENFFALSALAACAFGEYWGYRRENKPIAFVYFAIGIFTLCYAYRLWLEVYAYVFIASAVSVILYWYGATVQSVFPRCVALILAACALGVASVPEYWERALCDASVERFGAFAFRAPAILGSIVFILYCLNLVFGGAQYSSIRFVLGVVSFGCWILAQTFFANRSFGATGAAAVLFVAAVAVALLLVWNARLTKRNEELIKNGADPNDPRFVGIRSNPCLSKDARYNDDLFEAEARVANRSIHVFALAAAYQYRLDRFLNRGESYFIASAVALQIAIALLNLFAERRFF